MKPKFRQLYRDLALRVAALSYAKRLQVGAIVVKDDRIISMGYNGMPAGWENDCEHVELMPFNYTNIEDYPFLGDFWRDGQNVKQRYRLVTRPEVLHAESNAIAKLAKSNDSGLGADLFSTHSPCIECAKLIYQSGIRRVYYGQDYRDDSGVKFLKASGVEVVKHDDE